MGVSWNEFWNMNPRIISCLAHGYQEKLKQQDYMNWLSNQYTFSAVETAIEHMINGKRAKSEYIKEPLLMKFLEESQLTEEERLEIEMRKEILAMEQWIANDKARGLPETSIQ